MTGTCLEDATVLGFVEGTLSDRERVTVLTHVDQCEDCRVLVAQSAKATFRTARDRVGERYVLLDVVGAGGMSVVYSAFDTKLDRKVALKALRSSLTPALLAQEARTMARLSHPNLVTVFDVLTV